ncbi:MAG: FtsW/RodA/SpoVE family cell cycle protein [Phycisphaerales bacterium]|nr:FtsW/RodA/SpoVE family cell cycle protein [Phycisphaerales bacterium]
MTLFKRYFGQDASLLTPAWLSVVAAIALTLLGAYCIDVASQLEAPSSAAELAPRTIKHLVFMGVGMVAALGIALPDYKRWRLAAWPILGGCILLLIFLLVPFVPSWLVAPRNGVRGWIDLGPIDLQPSELTKLAFVLCAAEYLRVRQNHRTMLGLVPPAAVAAIPTGLIFLQPDLGTAMLFVPVLFAMLLAAGARARHLLLVCVLAALAAPAAWPALKPYQRQRIVDVYRDFTGSPRAGSPTAEQPQTARMLLGAGQTWGLSDSRTRAVVRSSRLPERHNDMIFAVYSARFGFVGGLAMLALYALWLAGALLTGARTRDGFGRLVCVGVATFIFCQIAINLGMVVGILPVIGITLPFVSYGGSSLVSVWLMTGFVMAIGLRKPPPFSSPAFQFED